MKALKILLLLPVFAFALQSNPIKTEVSFTGEPLLAIKLLQHAFGTVGYRLEIEHFSVGNGSGFVKGSAVGMRAFDPRVLVENLQDGGIKAENVRGEKGVLKLSMDTTGGEWGIAVIGTDEGAELQRVNTPQWYRIQHGQTIRIEPPFVGKWYPDIAVFDRTMRPLYSFRSSKPREELSIELPEGAFYLKVSNVWGMKVLKEGMWIESISPGR